jgi:antitoxin component of MazEF toxin-antitoxin module
LGFILGRDPPPDSCSHGGILRVPIVEIGNSRGIRIPHAILKQVSFGEEVEMEVTEGKITLRRLVDPALVPELSALAGMDDRLIQRILRKLKGSDLITSLIGADEEVKAAVYRNLSDRVREYVTSKVGRLEKGDARDLIIEQSRNAFSEAIMETLKE